MGDPYALAISPDSADTLLLGAATGLWRSEDGGSTWTELLRNAPITSVAFGPDPGRIFAYIAVPGRGMTRSTDAGVTWKDLGLLVEGQDAIAYIAPHPTKEGTLTVGSFERNIYRTTDTGQTWAMLAEAGVPQE